MNEHQTIAMQIALVALFRSHPDKRALRSAMGQFASELQTRATQETFFAPMPDALRTALEFYSSQLDEPGAGP